MHFLAQASSIELASVMLVSRSITQATENSKMIIGRDNKEKLSMRSFIMENGCWSAINQVCSNKNCITPYFKQREAWKRRAQAMLKRC